MAACQSWQRREHSTIHTAAQLRISPHLQILALQQDVVAHRLAAHNGQGCRAVEQAATAADMTEADAAAMAAAAAALQHDTGCTLQLAQQA